MIRYTIGTIPAHPFPLIGLIEQFGGEFVKYSDHAVECHRLSRERDEWERAACDYLDVCAERDRLRLVVRDCARTLQHNLSMYAIKDEPMMLKSLDAAWDAVGREYCESDPPNAKDQPAGASPARTASPC